MFPRRTPGLMTALTLTVIAGLSLFAQPAHAQFFTNGTGLSNPATTVTFSEVSLPNGTPLTTQYSAYGVTFTNLYYNPQSSFSSGPISPPDAGNFIGNGTAAFNPFDIFFTAPQTQADFALVSNPGTTTFTALLGGVSVASSGPISTSSSVAFYGFTGITFDQIEVNMTGSNPSGLLDNIQYGTASTSTPEPASYAAFAMGGIGLLGLGLKARRSRMSA